MATNEEDVFGILRNVVGQLEGLSSEDRGLVVKWTCERLGIGQPSSTAPITHAQPVSEGSAITTAIPTNIKSFVEEKNPQADTHFAAVVAYYYRFLAPERKEAISTDDLQDAARLSQHRRLQNPAKTVANAISTGLMDSAGRGLYRINTVGENLVAMVLPDVTRAGSGSTLKRKSVKKAVKKAKTVTKKRR